MARMGVAVAALFIVAVAAATEEGVFIDTALRGEIINLLDTTMGEEPEADIATDESAGDEPAAEEANDEDAKVKPLEETTDLPDGKTEGDDEKKPKTAGLGKVYTYAGTLQHVTNRFCTEREHKHGSGQIFCNELIAMQHSWIDAESKGTTQKYTRFLGYLMGHYCPDMDATRDARCLVLSLLTKSIPTDLKWNPDRKRYLQLTVDLGKHYCKVHGPKELFCPLIKALRNHYFHAVVNQDETSYMSYVKSLQDHYCVGEVNHPADERCNIFPLLMQALPKMMTSAQIDAMIPHAKVLEDKHATPKTDRTYPGENPGQDHSMRHKQTIQLEHLRAERAKVEAKKGPKPWEASEGGGDDFDISGGPAKFVPGDHE